MNKSRSEVGVFRVSESNLETYLPAICDVHIDAYPDGHFTNLLSRPHLLQYYRELILNSDISLVAEAGHSVLGFLISGTQVSRGVANFTHSHRALLMRILLLHPAMAAEKMSLLLNARLFKLAKSKATFRIMSIAVDPKAMRAGIGARLISELDTLLLGRGVTQVGLSVRKSNRNAIDFYNRLGFSVEMQNQWAVYYVKPTRPVE